ncbi:hypothetical protein GJW-30_1_01218 [Variibacter gotjawalensis]|uniref:DUF4241 domain-containing protein n=1 Tax=Variibacter gotjawalensis TaxID=1333996 RepID=A0A0S3PS31_9BRAD|nr:DUF4241 domain-containing protein [Variibacter gotjawalensis]NIK49001.1 hypothetical protein [Variibacter gotjawalensis]RZS50857.1 uncharacterized protein DUF4241 [Variibacter gotjawalensis]BAT58691.1 hypothetical protein GJW-30_1_01218 [Variibacter gotjawalensis]
MPERDQRAGDAMLSDGNLIVVDLTPDELAKRAIDVVPLGDLEVPSGKLVATDPIVDLDQAPFVREVPPGRYPVTLYEAGYFVALAAIRFAPGAVDHWELARLPGRGIAVAADPEEFHGHDVDSARSCFMDAQAIPAIKKDVAIAAENGDAGDYVMDLLAEENLMYWPLDDDPVNVAIFQSGNGDGAYQSYWGLCAAGTPLALVTDFKIIKNADARSPL